MLSDIQIAQNAHMLPITQVAEELGVEIQFTVIDWDNKIMELESQTIASEQHADQ